MRLSPRALLPVLTLAAGLAAGHAVPARADMMTTCAPEIRTFCANVTNGRGRVSSCLASRFSALSAACRTEVQAVMGSRLTPAYVRRAMQPGFSAPMPQACVAPAGQLCSGLPANSGAQFACLYAYSDRIPRACTDAATATLRQ